MYKNIVSINDDFAQTTNNRLKANNVGFYFDYKNGKYGFNTSSGRGADTFSPFSAGISSWDYLYGATGNNVKNNNYTFTSSYKIVVCAGGGGYGGTGPGVTWLSNVTSTGSSTATQVGSGVAVKGSGDDGYHSARFFTLFNCNSGDTLSFTWSSTVVRSCCLIVMGGN